MMQSVAVSINMIYPIIVLRNMSPQEFLIVPFCHLVSRAPVMRPILLSLIVVTDSAFLILSNAASVDQGAHHMLHTVMAGVFMEAGHVSSIPAPGLLTGKMGDFPVHSLLWRLRRKFVLNPALTFLLTVEVLIARIVL